MSPPPKALLLECIERYIQTFRQRDLCCSSAITEESKILSTHMNPTSPTIQTSSSGPPIHRRGRQRQRMRRDIIYHRVYQKTYMAEPTKPDVLPSSGMHDETFVREGNVKTRGRLKRRLRRDEEYGRKRTPELLVEDKGKAIEHEQPRTLGQREVQTHEQPFPNMTLKHLLAQRLNIPTTEVPRCLIAVTERVSFGDALIAIPIKREANKKRPMGYLFVPKEDLWFERDAPSSLHWATIPILADLWELEIPQDATQAKIRDSPAEEYWAKFSIRGEGIYASEDEYCRQFLVLPPEKRVSDPTWEQQTAEWLKKVDENWCLCMLRWKTVKMQNMTAGVVGASLPHRPKALEDGLSTTGTGCSASPDSAENDLLSYEPTRAVDDETDPEQHITEFTNVAFQGKDFLMELDALTQMKYRSYVGPKNNGDVFYGARYLSLVSWPAQERLAQHVRKLSCDARKSRHVRAQALLQYSLYTFYGFGVPRNTEIGLAYFWQAAKAGSRQARAVVRRLFRSYGKDVPEELVANEWLAREAEAGSQWALKELEREDLVKFRAMLPHQAFREIIKSGESYTRYWLSPLTDSNKARKTWEELGSLFQQIKTELGVTIDGEERRLHTDETATAHHGSGSLINEFIQSAGLEWAVCFADCADVAMLLQFLATDNQVSLERVLRSSHLLTMSLLARRLDVVHLILDEMAVMMDQIRNPEPIPFSALQLIPDEEAGSIIAELVRVGVDVHGPGDVRALGAPIDNGHWHQESRGASMTPLRWAVENHRPAIVKALLDHGAEFPYLPDIRTNVDRFPEIFFRQQATIPVLDSPCYDVEILQMFLERHGGQCGGTVFSETPLGLIVAEPDGPQRRLRIGPLGCRENLFTVLDLLRGYQTDSDDEMFHAAVANGHLEVVEYLVLRGVSVELRCHGLTPILTAVLHGQRSIFDYLLGAGADLAAVTTRRGISAAHLIFWSPKPVEVEDYMLSELIKREIDVHTRGTPFGEKVSPLHLAVIGGRISAVATLLQHGADKLLVLGEEVMTSVVGASLTDWGIRRSKRFYKPWMEPWRDPVMVPIQGLTALGIVLRRWDMFTPEDALQLVQLLCTPSDDIRDFYVRPDIRQTAVHLACCHTVLVSAGVVEYILEQGRDVGLHVNIRDINGDTPLHYAAACGGGQRRLVLLGADAGARNEYGMTPTDVRFQAHGHITKSDPAARIDRVCIYEEKRDIDDMLQKNPSRRSPWATDSDGDSPVSRLWSQLEDGIFFRECWDIKAKKWRRFEEEIFLRVDVWREGSDFPYEGWLTEQEDST
ncbi:hypothetical protein CEP51_013609 [Fusarium floridanum]|uniref:Uncharacterized protein n=1 Tax=Fusarium floridanum TaxID=1325733 RepID=A0A428Q8F7_9HYPO|nr:hypothetical protein CEP51_013609 [Fusarium floridanum]